MNEETQEEVEREETRDTTEDTRDGNITQSTSPIEEARALSEKLESQIREYEELVKRQEQVTAEDMIRGRTDVTTARKKEEPQTDSDYAKNIDAQISKGKIA